MKTLCRYGCVFDPLCGFGLFVRLRELKKTKALNSDVSERLDEFMMN